MFCNGFGSFWMHGVLTGRTSGLVAVDWGVDSARVWLQWTRASATQLGMCVPCACDASFAFGVPANALGAGQHDVGDAGDAPARDVRGTPGTRQYSPGRAYTRLEASPPQTGAAGGHSAQSRRRTRPARVPASRTSPARVERAVYQTRTIDPHGDRTTPVPDRTKLHRTAHQYASGHTPDRAPGRDTRRRVRPRRPLPRCGYAYGRPGSLISRPTSG